MCVGWRRGGEICVAGEGEGEERYVGRGGGGEVCVAGRGVE